MTTEPLAHDRLLASNTIEFGLDGRSVICYCAYQQIEKKSLFLEENKLLIVKNGSLTIGHGKDEHEVCKGQMVFLKKDILISFQTASVNEAGVSVEFIMFSIKQDLVKEFARLVELPFTATGERPTISVASLDSRLHAYVASVEFYLHQKATASSSLVKIKLLELLFCLADTDRTILEQVLDVKDYFRPNITATVEENILNSISLHQLAVLSGRSLSSFRRDFLAIYNVPPSQWIRQKRLEKARELLLTTTMTVTDICYTTGFENIAHFSRLFKTYFGECPSETRQSRTTASC